MSTKKELDVLSSFIFCIYEKYVEGVNKYISEIKKYPKKIDYNLYQTLSMI